MKKFQVAAICGSMRFTNEMLKLQEKLSHQGVIVLLPCFSPEGDTHRNLPKETKAMFAEMHFKRIYMSDYIVVVNPEGYIGESTRAEIEYANKIGVGIVYTYDKS